MNFRKWFEEKSEEEVINRPYYRIVNGIYGKSDNLNDRFGPGSYWTPRWDAIQMMMATTLKYYHQTKSAQGEKDLWTTNVYQINRAIMQKPPQEHQWAFNHSGERVLVNYPAAKDGGACHSNSKQLLTVP